MAIVYRSQVLTGGRWLIVGVDCHSHAEAVAQCAAMCPANAFTRVQWVGC